LIASAEFWRVQLAEHKHDEKRDESFKVIDRRPFTAEGVLRQEVVDENRRESEVAAKIAATKEAANKEAAAKSDAERKAAAVEARPGPVILSDASGDVAAPALAADADLPPASRSFQTLVDFLARNAAAMLGGMSDPRTGQPFLDIEGAREMIDMLDVLREKTMGNLAHEDDALLLEVIGSLKLSFMEISKAAAAAMAEKARGKGK
jgi:Domain of unknown function (DUF1844)